MASIVSSYGGQPIAAPSMREVPLESNPEAIAFADALERGEFDLVILLTGVGTRALVSVVERVRGSRDAFVLALRRTKVVARGPKPVAVLRELEVPVWLTAPEPNTWREVLSALDGKRSEFSLDGLAEKDLPRVEIVYSHANYGREVIDFLVSKGVKGIVLAGVGDGNSTDTAIAALAEAAKKGVAVVRSTRTGSGLVVRNIEIDDDKLGFMAAMELNPQKARILLMLGLMKSSDPKKLQELFMVY